MFIRDLYNRLDTISFWNGSALWNATISPLETWQRQQSKDKWQVISDYSPEAPKPSYVLSFLLHSYVVPRFPSYYRKDQSCPWVRRWRGKAPELSSLFQSLSSFFPKNQSTPSYSFNVILSSNWRISASPRWHGMEPGPPGLTRHMFSDPVPWLVCSQPLNCVMRGGDPQREFFRFLPFSLKLPAKLYF